jgi:hypothetical protein
MVGYSPTDWDFRVLFRGVVAAAEQLVTELRNVRVQAVGDKSRTVVGEFVEPVQLLVVCQNLWKDLPANVDIIDSDHLKRFGKISRALATFYKRALRQTTEDTDVDEETLRDWFEKTLITPAGTRGTVYRGVQETGGHRDIAFALNYGPVGLGLASGGSDATVCIWEVRTLFEPE